MQNQPLSKGQPWWRRHGLLVLFGALALSRLVFLVPSFEDLITASGGGDLQARRAELNWVVRGVDPELARQRVLYDLQASGKSAKTASEAWRLTEPSLLPTNQEIAVGAFSDGDFSSYNPRLAAYPPWSYPLLAPLMWPGWPSTATYFAFVTVLSLLGLWWLLVRDFDDARGLALLVVLVPMSAYAAAVHTGQLSIVVMLALAGFGVLLQRGRYGAAGLCLAFASVKPTMSLLFAFVLAWPLLRGRATLRQASRTGLIAGLIIAVSSCLVWLRVGVDPVTALGRVMSGNANTVVEGYGLLPLIGRALPRLEWLSTGFAISGVVLAVFAVWVLRNHSLLCQFAVVGVLARLWAYHRHYDDLLLLFLLLGLLVEVRRGSQLGLAALIMVAMTLATPAPTSPSLELWRVATWLAASAVLVWEAWPLERGRESAGPNGFLVSSG